MYVCMYVCPFVRDIVFKLQVLIPHGKKVDLYFFLELSPLVKIGPFEKHRMKFCKCHVSESIKAKIFGHVSADR